MKLLNKFKIWQKIGGGFLILIILSLFLGVYSIVNNTKIKNQTDEIVNGILKHTQLFTELKYDVSQIQNWMTDISATRGLPGFDDGLKEAENYYKESNKVLNLLIKDHQAEPEMLKQLNSLKEKLDKFYKVGTEMAKIYINKGPEAGNEFMAKFDPIAEGMYSHLNKLVEQHQNDLKMAFKEINKHQSNVSKSLGFVLCVLLLLSVTIAYLIVKNITTNINSLMGSCDIAKTGDLRESFLIDSQDELGELSKFMNNFVGTLKDMMLGVKKIAFELASMSTELSTSMEEISATTSEIANGVSTTNASIENSGAAVTEMAANIQELSKNIQTMTDYFENITISTNSGAEAVQHAMSAMGKIKKSSEKIAGIVTLITEIAGQTNLLSLNAAIEAAKAGEMGKGFAVVAEEVRKLAERSGDAAKQISDLISDSTHEVDNGYQTVETAGTTLEDILGKVGETSALVSEINNASEEQSRGVEDIVRTTDEVSNLSAQNATATEEISSTISEVVRTLAELAHLGEELKEKTEGFVLE